MPIREFRDPEGGSWRVWSTRPDESSPLARRHPGGWLTFDNGGPTLRRLAPIPTGWLLADEVRLDLMCRAAREVPRHTTNTPTGEMARIERSEPG